MHTVELLEEALTLAGRLGYKLRQEWLGGSGGGGCEIAGQKWIFIDLALTPTEQFDQVVETLCSEPGIADLAPSPALRRALGLRKAA